MSLLKALESELNDATTANGAVAYRSTLDPVLDFFSKVGSMRGRNEEAYQLFLKAYASDRILALRALFWSRDARGGAGQRDVFRYIFSQLDKDDKEALVKHVPFYGRWDDMDFSEHVKFVQKQLLEDVKLANANGNVSLLAKWLPSENTSSYKTRAKATELRKLLNLDSRTYRKSLSLVRRRINLLEQLMSARRWEDIEFEKLPSQAHKRHVEAFNRHLSEKYKNYIGKVEKGEAKINASVLYPHEVIKMVSSGKTSEANAFWKNLEDYTNGKNALVVADVSGSMYGGYGDVKPIEVSVALALYFAERNNGAFKDHFLTFSDRSSLQKVVGNTLKQKLDSIERAEWGMSTNIESAFNAILNAALKDKVPQEEMPSTLYIISDMQFNPSIVRGVSNFEAIRSKYEAEGYQLPHVVFWNVNPYGNQPVLKNEKNVTLISGYSPSAFKFAFEGKTPLESMMEVLTSSRYERIV